MPPVRTTHASASARREKAARAAEIAEKRRRLNENEADQVGVLTPPHHRDAQQQVAFHGNAGEHVQDEEDVLANDAVGEALGPGLGDANGQDDDEHEQEEADLEVDAVKEVDTSQFDDIEEFDISEDDDVEIIKVSTGKRGRKKLDDVPEPCLDGLDGRQKEAALKKYRLEKNRLALRRSRAKKKASQERARVESAPLVLRTLEEIRQQWPEDVLAIGKSFATKEAFQHAVREVAESYSLRIHFPKNTAYVVTAKATNISPDNFTVSASFNASRHNPTYEPDAWTILTSHISGNSGGVPKEGENKTARSLKDLACIIEDLVREKPEVEAKIIRTTLKPYVAHIDAIQDHQITRIRRLAMESVYGKPSENIKHLPALQRLFEQKGHHLRYSTIDGNAMAQTVLSVAKAEHERYRKQAIKVPAANRTEQQKKDAVPWDHFGRAEWLRANNDLMQQIRKPGRRYVEWVEVSFNHAEVVYTELLSLVNQDASFGKQLLDVYQIFAVIGFTADMNIIPLMYIYVCGNESTESWTRAQASLKERFPDLEDMEVTFTTDQEKGLHNAVDSVWPNHLHFVCAYHRKKNLARYGKSTVKMFDELCYAPTTAKLYAIKDSAKYISLGDGAKAALESLDDKRQFLASAAAVGAQTYGKATSQGVESLNSAILPARQLDLVSSILKLLELDCKRYQDNYARAWNSPGRNTPWAVKKLAKLAANIGAVEEMHDQSTATKTCYLVKVKVNGSDTQYEVKLLRPLEGDNEDTLFGDCTCGIPMRDNFPCAHMRTVARTKMLHEPSLVPVEFTVGAWRKQYPADLAFHTVSKQQLLAEYTANPGDGDSLAYPPACPPKKGRPSKKRIRHAVELSAQRRRRRNGDD